MKKGDKIILNSIITLIICSLICIFVYRMFYKNKEVVAIIKQEGKVIKKVELKKIKNNQKINIPYKDGEFNIIEIEKNRIRFIDANCPDKVCVKAGWLTKAGDSAACIPHKIIITIQGKNKEVDDIAY